jgi:N-acetylglucosamine-6-sulfatase
MKPNFLVILIDDLRYDEYGAGGHPYMKTPHIDRIAHEGALFEGCARSPRTESAGRSSFGRILTLGGRQATSGTLR